MPCTIGVDADDGSGHDENRCMRTCVPAAIRRAAQPHDVRQIISMVNVNPEDYVDSKPAAELTRQANEELSRTVRDHPDLFSNGVAMICANNIDATVATIEQIASRRARGDDTLVGIQVFTRHLGRSVADPMFRPIFAACAAHDVPLWLHPVFDARKPDKQRRVQLGVRTVAGDDADRASRVFR